MTQVGRRRVQRLVRPPAQGRQLDVLEAAERGRLGRVGVEAAAQLVALVEQRLVHRQRRRAPRRGRPVPGIATRQGGGDVGPRARCRPTRRRRRARRRAGRTGRRSASGSAPAIRLVARATTSSARATAAPSSSRSRRAASSCPGQSSRTDRRASSSSRAAGQPGVDRRGVARRPAQWVAERHLGRRVERLGEAVGLVAGEAGQASTGIAGPGDRLRPHALHGGDDGADDGELLGHVRQHLLGRCPLDATRPIEQPALGERRGTSATTTDGPRSSRAASLGRADVARSITSPSSW